MAEAPPTPPLGDPRRVIYHADKIRSVKLRIRHIEERQALRRQSFPYWSNEMIREDATDKVDLAHLRHELSVEEGLQQAAKNAVKNAPRRPSVRPNQPKPTPPRPNSRPPSDSIDSITPVSERVSKRIRGEEPEPVSTPSRPPAPPRPKSGPRTKSPATPAYEEPVTLDRSNLEDTFEDVPLVEESPAAPLRPPGAIQEPIEPAPVRSGGRVEPLPDENLGEWAARVRALPENQWMQEFQLAHNALAAEEAVVEAASVGSRVGAALGQAGAAVGRVSSAVGRGIQAVAESPVTNAFATAAAIIATQEDVDSLMNTLVDLSKDHVWAGNLLAAGRDSLELAMNPLLAFALAPYLVYRFGSAAINIAKGLRAGSGPIDTKIGPKELALLPSNLVNKGNEVYQYFKNNGQPQPKVESTIFSSEPWKRPRVEARSPTPSTETIDRRGQLETPNRLLHPHQPSYIKGTAAEVANYDDQAIIDYVQAHSTPEEWKHYQDLANARNNPPAVVVTPPPSAESTQLINPPEHFKPGMDTPIYELAQAFSQAPQTVSAGKPAAVFTGRTWRHPVTGQTWEQWMASRSAYVN